MNHRKHIALASLLLAVWMLPCVPAIAADCKEKLADVDKLGTEIAMPEAQQLQLKQLREAAGLLMHNGRNDMCEQLADNMKNMLQEQRDANRTAREQAQKIERVEGAKQVSEIAGVVRASKLIGSPVRNTKAEELGKIENIAIDANTGAVAYAVMSHGGFLGLGEKLIPVPWSQLRRTSDGEVFVLDIDKKVLDKITGFDKDNWPSKAAADRFWQPAPKQ